VIHSESGDDFIYGQRGSHPFSEKGRMHLIGGYGFDRIYGGSREDVSSVMMGASLPVAMATEPLNGLTVANVQVRNRDPLRVP
jgi:hypothetical protein